MASLSQPKHWYTDFGVRMVSETLRVGFDEIGLHRIDLGVFTFNTSAIRCYHNAGFVEEGILREGVRADDGYWDMLQMSILEQEWEALKAEK